MLRINLDSQVICEANVLVGVAKRKQLLVPARLSVRCGAITNTVNQLKQ
uniref:Uncharacterized protein n=1 Tax=Loigolactobacillus rennini TaxID=238013 RepID=A0A1K2I9H4_9LACO|nr:hypothetical protein LREN565_2134 [Loigolactobacillus rennini]